MTGLDSSKEELNSSDTTTDLEKRIRAFEIKKPIEVTESGTVYQTSKLPEYLAEDLLIAFADELEKEMGEIIGDFESGTNPGVLIARNYLRLEQQKRLSAYIKKLRGLS